MINTQYETHQTKAKITEIESLRGIAALLVVLFHIPKWNPILNIGLFNNGYLMVELFFVLSGFVIFSAYSNNISSKRDLVRFQFLRFGRLYPVHFLFLIVFILIELAKYYAQPNLNLVSQNSQPFRENNITALFENLFLIQAMGPTGNVFTFNYPSWSIGVEFYTYFIFGLLILFFKKYRSILITTIALLALILIETENTYGMLYLLKCLAGFFIGCMTVDLAKKIKIKIPQYFSLIIFTLIVVYLQTKKTGEYDFLIYFLTSSLLISLIFSTNGILKKILNLKILTLLGLISYSVYMSHAAVLWIASQVVKAILNRPLVLDASGRMIPQLSQLETIASAFISIVSVLIVSCFVYNFIEKPMRSKSRLIAAKI